MASKGPVAATASETVRSTSSKGFTRSGAAKAKPKTLLEFLAAYWWVSAAAACVFFLIYGICHFFGNDPRTKAMPNAKVTNANVLSANVPASSNIKQSGPVTSANQSQAKVQAGMECPSKKHDDCTDGLACIMAVKAVAETKAANGTVATPAQVEGRYYCKAKVAGMECRPKNNECTDGLVCIKAVKAVAETKVAVGTVWPAQKTGKYYCKVAVGGECPSRQNSECVDDAVCGSLVYTLRFNIASTVSARDSSKNFCQGFLGVTCGTNDNHCWQPGPHVGKATCFHGLCQVVAATSGCGTTSGCCDGFEKNEDGVCKAGEGEYCNTVKSLASHYLCGKDLKCKEEGGDWKCTKVTKPSQIQIGETTNAWHAANRSRSMQSDTLRNKRTRTAGFLQVDGD